MNISNSDTQQENENKNIKNHEEKNGKIKDDINKQINILISINIPKIMNKITEYLIGNNKIYKEEKYIVFADKLRSINQKISEFLSEEKTSFKIGEKIEDSFISTNSDDYETKKYKENKSYYDNFYPYSFRIKINEKINLKEEYIASFLNSIQNIFEEFNFLLKIKDDNILPQFSNLEADSHRHIQFFNKIHDLYISLNNNNKILNNSDFQKDLIQTKLFDTETRSIGSTFSEFKVNIVESIDEFIMCKEDSISIDFIKLNAKKLNDLSFLKDSTLVYLKRLELRTNYIKDISPLKDCSCSNLINLNISHNQLNNDSVEILLHMKLDNLEKLILFDNKITTVKILKLGENFKKLKKFHIGKNLLNEKEIIENINEFKLSESIVNIGMSSSFNNCFVNKKNIDINFFKYITLENIKLLYLNRNELYSLKCFKNNNFNRLEMVWLTYNNISDLEEIKYFHNEKNKKTLNVFLLNGNNISSISDNFIKLLDQFELNILNISLNPIKLEDFKDKVQLIEKKGISLQNL